MADLDYGVSESMEDLFNMRGGYVINFTNKTFREFVKGTIGIDVYNDEVYIEYPSKAKKLRHVFEIEPITKVNKLINSLLNYYEDYKLKLNELNDYDKKKITDIRESLKESIEKKDNSIIIDEELDILFRKISTRQASFTEMTTDEKLKEISNLIENLLKQNGRYIKLDYNSITLGLLNEEHIKDLRGKLNCYRHSTFDSLEERKNHSKNQKQFMIEFGITICGLIHNEVNK